MLFGNRRKKMGITVLLAFVSICLYIPSVVAQTVVAQNAPTNLDFESPDPSGNQIGPPWYTGLFQQSYEVSIDSNGAYHGKYWVSIRSVSTPGKNEFANLSQSFDATPYRGKFIKYRAAVRHIGNTHGDIRLWMRVDRVEKHKPFFTSKTDRPIQSTDWEEYQIIGYVAQDAINIFIGCSLLGEGTIGFDDVTIDTASIANELIHDFQIPEYITFEIAGGGTEDVKSDDIDKITATGGKAVVWLKSGRRIQATGNYDELARYFEKSK